MLSKPFFHDCGATGQLEKPEKVYLNNPNLYHALAGGKDPDSGAMRETFFLGMLRVGHSVSVPANGN